ncbi:TorD/DmsD family molecular chaperone [Gordonibacter massiliensis (ex Traore et al. 2017)]|uniref:Molecular chaperone TorD family protein n=1 Tax=Gordonibacter massiliensis (ex Traore et al. 2017) TaxID=1841863 RepID=A0A842JAA7_9ACTN|nr:molecular chaperone TorD family protein [Gordonibacter massiliensis (ex Traore et al. 2017)]MBC2888753.1 molecular chaperone TorD family protein [Gordonibacter massiliensis (ex Traore et al. 2017)]
MSNNERESAIAMMLARRAYLYRLLHVVFGGRPSGDVVSPLFGEETLATFAYVRDTLSQDEYADLAARPVGTTGRSLAACVDEAIACIERAGREAADPALADSFVEGLRTDYDQLFQVPGDRYVHLWESPYTGQESMVFQESTLDVRAFYHAAGFKLQAEKRFPDDHIAAMMDYLGCMGQRAYEAFADGCDDEVLQTLATQRRFAERHVLNWVDLFADKVVEQDVRGYYAAFALGMAAFVRLDDEMVGRLEKELAGE